MNKDLSYYYERPTDYLTQAMFDAHAEAIKEKGTLPEDGSYFAKANIFLMDERFDKKYLKLLLTDKNLSDSFEVSASYDEVMSTVTIVAVPNSGTSAPDWCLVSLTFDSADYFSAFESINPTPRFLEVEGL